MPNRHYSDTALTEDLVFNVTTYEKTVLVHDFDSTTHAWNTSTNPSPGPTAASVDGRLQVASTKQNSAVFFNYDTEVGEKYKFYVVVDEGDCDSLLIRVQEVPVSLKEERYIGTGLHEFEFTATTSKTRLRLHRKDANKQGTMYFYLDHVTLKRVRDTLYQDTVIVATSNGYRYGFNGMERDDEAKGVGNYYDFGLRTYDPRLARFFSIDPRTPEYPWQSPYVYHRNSPVFWIDYLGGGDEDPKETIKDYKVKDGDNLTYLARDLSKQLGREVTVKEIMNLNYTDWNSERRKGRHNWIFTDEVLIVPGLINQQEDKIQNESDRNSDKSQTTQDDLVDFTSTELFEGTIQIFEGLKENMVNEKGIIPMDDIIDFDKLEESQLFTLSMVSYSSPEPTWSSKDPKEPCIQITTGEFNYFTNDYGASDASGLIWEINAEGTKISYYWETLPNGQKIGGLLQVYAMATVKGGEYNNRLSGVVINFDMSNPHHVKRFKELNRRCYMFYVNSYPPNFNIPECNR